MSNYFNLFFKGAFQLYIHLCLYYRLASVPNYHLENNPDVTCALIGYKSIFYERIENGFDVSSRSFSSYFLKGIKQHRLCFQTSLENGYDVRGHSKSREKTRLRLVFSQHFSRALLRHSVLYYCLETHAMLFYPFQKITIKKKSGFTNLELCDVIR